MADYMILKSGMIKDTVNNLFIPQDEANSDYQVYLKWCDGLDRFGNDLGTGTNTPDEEAAVTLEEAQTAKVSELKAMANGILTQTDWYVIRNTETATSVPSDITSYRDSIRTYTDTAEAEILALTNVDSVESYTFSFPTM